MKPAAVCCHSTFLRLPSASCSAADHWPVRLPHSCRFSLPFINSLHYHRQVRIVVQAARGRRDGRGVGPTWRSGR
jgi:hypothetical protein